MPSLARTFGVPNRIVLSRLASNQDLLSGYANTVFEHGIFVCPYEQVVHSYEGLFSKGLEERCARADTPLKDLEDNVHDVRLYLEYSLLELFYKFPQRFILMHFYVLQGADILLMLC